MIQKLTCQIRCILGFTLMLFLSCGIVAAGQDTNLPKRYLVQMPYTPPPQPDFTPGEKATPAPDQLSEQEQQRLDTLLPLLDGNQELWAIGEFVHFGKHSVPHLLKALKMKG